MHLKPSRRLQISSYKNSKPTLVDGWQWGHGPWKHFPYIQVRDLLCYEPIPKKAAKLSVKDIKWASELDPGVKKKIYF